MQTYRLGEGVNAEGLPFLFAGNAYLADGWPLTKCDAYGRIVPAHDTLKFSKATCSGGLSKLAERRSGVEVLARALNEGDLVRAPLLLLFLQIDPVEDIAKYNPWHKPKGTGGGQFTTGPGGGFQTVAQDMNVRFESTYKPGAGDETIDIAHQLVMDMVGLAILKVDNLKLKPGMSGYGQALHRELDAEIKALGNPNFRSNPIYLGGNLLPDGAIPAGASLPDVVYGPPDRSPLIVWELKTGRAVDTSDAAITEQRDRTLENIPGNPLYEYIFVWGQ